MSRLLVVDDDPVVLTLVSLRLQNGGHRVVTATDADAALEIVAEKGLPDLAVLDVSLPGMTGLELLQTLRTKPAAEHLPAVFLSARVQPGDVEAGRAMGATYLTKPFVASALLAAVDKALAEQAADDDDGW